jgi:hypothetical protein
MLKDRVPDRPPRDRARRAGRQRAGARRPADTHVARTSGSCSGRSASAPLTWIHSPPSSPRPWTARCCSTWRRLARPPRMSQNASAGAGKTSSGVPAGRCRRTGRPPEGRAGGDDRRRAAQPLGARPATAVNAMVCVHHAGSAHRARNPSTARSSRWPEPTRRGRSSVTVPGQPARPEPPDLGGLRDADRQEVRLDEQNRAARPRAGHQVRYRGPGVGDMVQHGAGRHQVKTARRHRPALSPPPSTPARNKCTLCNSLGTERIVARGWPAVPYWDVDRAATSQK